MIVRNEQSTLERCISSLAGLTHDLCIVDTGSSDSTVEIAQSFARKVVVDLSCNNEQGEICDFSLARNISLDLASGEWILCIDADEVLDLQSKPYIIHHTESNSADSIAVEVSSGQNFWPAIRLFRKHELHRFEGIIHERIRHPLNPILDTNIKIRNLPNKHGKESSIERDIRMCLIGMSKDPEEVRYALYYARALNRAGDYRQAIKLFNRCIELGIISSSLLHSIFTEIATCYLLLSEWQNAISAGLQALEFVDDVAQTYCVIGDALLAQGDVKLASGNYQKAISLDYPPHDYPLFVDKSFYGSYPQEQLSLCKKIIKLSMDCLKDESI